MKQKAVPISEGRGGMVSPAASRTRVTSREAPPAMTPAPGVTTRTTTTMAAAARRQQQRLSVPMPPVSMRKKKVSTKECAEPEHQEETVEEEVVRLRGEVEALQREVQRLLRLNADLQKGLIMGKTIVSSDDNDRSQQEQANKPKPATTVPPPPPPPPTKESHRVPARPPPPPPPPPRQQGPFTSRLSPVNKAAAVVDTYNSLLTNKLPQQQQRIDKGRSHHHHSNIVGELQNRSTHLLSIKADVETKAEFINDLIRKVHTGSFADVEQVLTFVDWLDQQLSTLSDETAVLKHFNWPERKADTLREAASEYRNLKHLLTDVSSLSLNDDGGVSSSSKTCEATLRKISGLLPKLEKNMNRLVNLRSTVMPSYKELRIPTDWMLDSGMALKMRLASVNLAKKYMKSVLKELDSRRDDTAANGASLVAQSVRFTYRVHQFAGGLDSEAMHAFEELRVRMLSSP